MNESKPTLNVLACLAGVAAVLAPVAVKAVAEAIKDPDIQSRLGEAGALLFRPREG